MLALVACGWLARPAGARAQGGGEDEIAPGAKVTKIGPQAIVVEAPNGRITMYDDPAGQARECDSRGACAGKALGAFGVFFALVYEELTTNVEGSSRPAGPNGVGGAE